MAFWDLTKQQQQDLLQELHCRAVTIETGAITPGKLQLEFLRKKYALTKSDMVAILKGDWNGKIYTRGS